MPMTEKVRKAGRRAYEANMLKRRALAEKYGLTVSDFMPKHIRNTLKRRKIPESSIPEGLIPSAKNPFPGVPMDGPKANGSSIPLSAIPERPTKGARREYSEEFKKQAVAMLTEKSITEVSRELAVADNLLRHWGKKYDPAWAIKGELIRATEARRQRLEIAATIVEAEGARGAEIAMRIRDLATPRPVHPSYAKKFQSASWLNKGHPVKAGRVRRR